MASDARQQAIDLTRRLLARGDHYSFFQAYRLLRLLANQEGVSAQEAIRVRPHLGLGFPKNDLQSIEAVAPQRFQVTANFMGLYGVDSPIQTFYTEELLDEQSEGQTVNREFLDIFAQSIYPMFFDAWLKARPALRVVEFGDERMLQILYAFVGIENPRAKFSQPGVGSLLHCGALYNQQTRTAAGLQAILKTSFPEAQVEVKQLQIAWVPIAEEQRMRLGKQACGLGDTTHLGFRCRTFDGVTIVLKDLPLERYRELTPGGIEHERLRFLIDYYLIEPLPLHVELRLRPGDAQKMQLASNNWSSLGRDTWLVSTSWVDPACMSFDLVLRKPMPETT